MFLMSNIVLRIPVFCRAVNWQIWDCQKRYIDKTISLSYSIFMKIGSWNIDGEK